MSFALVSLFLFFRHWGALCDTSLMSSSPFVFLTVENGRVLEKILQRQSGQHKRTNEREKKSEMDKDG